MSHNVRRIGCAVVLVLVAASAAQALPLNVANTAGGSERGILAAVWDWMASVWEAEGCQIDPNGQCRPGESRQDVPAGRSLTPSWEKAGCQMDPDGKPCVPSVGARGTSVEKIGALQRGRN